MKKLVFSACALTLTGGTAVANDSDWAQLDQDVQALSASLQGLEGNGLTIGGRIRAIYENSGDVQVGVNDLGGFALYNARLYATGTTANDIGYRFEHDFATGNLLDAYIDIPVGGEVMVRAGQFRGMVLNESQIDSGNLFFVDRSLNAALFAGRRNGIALAGDFDAFDWAVTVQNGTDGLGDDLFYAIRGGIDLLGEGTQAMEGAYGASEEMESTASIAYFNDDASVLDSDGFALEATLASSDFSAQFNVVSLGDAPIASQFDFNERMPTFYVLGNVADSTSFSLGGTWMLTQPSSDYGAWEVGIRYQDPDDTLNTNIIDVGVNYYVDGHNMKYIINWTGVDSDPGGFDGDIIRIGVNTRI